MDKVKLKPCPFCGGKAGIREYGNGHSGNGEFIANYEVGCEKCRIHFRAESRFTLKMGQPEFSQNGFDTCVEKWNARAYEKEKDKSE